jgi:Leucine-rich repeat (LRR) protein
MLKVIFSIFPLIFLASAQDASISCNYNMFNVTGVENYRCILTVNNTQGFDEFSEISGEHLPGLTNADVTILQSGSGYSTIVPRIICAQFPNLERINLSNLDIQTITATSFNGCRNLDWLRLLSNGISSLSVDSFANNERLTYLDLDRNLIPELHEDIFVNVVNLEVLELRNNPYRVPFPGGLFRTLVNLKTLYLDNCRITEINTDWFLNKLNLEFLTLYTNQLRSVQAGTFTNVQSLFHLDLGSNLISNIHPEAFSPLINLQSLYLEFNWIENLPSGLFSQNNLRILNLWGNGLKTLQRNPFGNISNLMSLDCDDNLISSIEQSFIDDAIALSTLWFSNNVCASTTLTNFVTNRVGQISRLQSCFNNFGYIVGLCFINLIN